MNNLVTFLWALLGGLGGQGKKSLRRFGIPTELVLIGYYYLRSFWSIGFFSYCASLSLGYGLPSINDPKPSKLGLFAYKFFPYKLENQDKKDLLNKKLCGATVRGIIALLKVCSIFPLLIVGKNLIYLLIGSICLVLSNLIITWIDPKGTFKFFKKEILFSEFWLYFFDLLIILWTISVV